MFPACLFGVKPLHSCGHFHRWSQGASKRRQVGCPHFIMNLFIYFYLFINFLFKTGSHGSERLSTQVPSTKWGKPRMTRGSGLVDVSVTVPWIFTLTTHSSPLADPLRASVSLPGRLLYNTIQTKRVKAPKKSNKKWSWRVIKRAAYPARFTPSCERAGFSGIARKGGTSCETRQVHPFVIPSCSSCTRPLRLPLRWSW